MPCGGCCPGTTATCTGTGSAATVPSPSLSVPVLDGRLQLGTWQHVVLVDTNADNPRRQVRLSFLSG